MDEYNSGMDPEVKLYFRKIIRSFSAGLLWLLCMATAGLFFRLALIQDGIRWYNLLFYAIFLITLMLLLRYLNRLWRK